jgi:hypothetical protein
MLGQRMMVNTLHFIYILLIFHLEDFSQSWYNVAMFHLAKVTLFTNVNYVIAWHDFLCDIFR